MKKTLFCLSLLITATSNAATLFSCESQFEKYRGAIVSTTETSVTLDRDKGSLIQEVKITTHPPFDHAGTETKKTKFNIETKTALTKKVNSCTIESVHGYTEDGMGVEIRIYECKTSLLVEVMSDDLVCDPSVERGCAPIQGFLKDLCRRN